MALIVPDVGEALMLKRILNNSISLDDLVIHLFTNNYNPVEATVLGDLVESDDTGYAAITLIGANWTIGGSPTEASYSEQQFILNGDGSVNTIYGFYITDNAGTGLYWVERFSDAPYDLSSGGSVYITPKIQLA